MSELKTLKETNWLKTFTDWEHSKLTISEFCETHEICKRHFARKRSEYIARGLVRSCRHNAPCHKGKNKSKKLITSQKLSFLPISQTPSDKLPDKSLTSLSKERINSPDRENKMLEISLPNGISIRIPTDASY